MSSSSTLRLPIEILEIVVQKAAESDIRSGYEWLGRVDEMGKQCWDPLRALSQTCRYLRRLALPLIWEVIVINAPGEDWDELRWQIRRLVKRLTPKTVKTSIPLPLKTQALGKIRAVHFKETPAMARWIRDVHIYVAWPEEDEEGGDGHGDRDGDGDRKAPSSTPIIGAGLEAQPPWRLWSANDTLFDPVTTPVEPTRWFQDHSQASRRISAILMRELSQALTRCPNLEYVAWVGWLTPDQVITSRLKSIPSLLAFHIDLGPQATVYRTSAGWKIHFLGRWNRSTSPQQRMAASNVHLFDRDADEDHAVWGRLNSQKGSVAVDWLIAIGMPTHLSFIDLELVTQSWMVPLWAQLERLVWRGGPQTSWYFHGQEGKIWELLHAAQMFRRVLLDSTCMLDPSNADELMLAAEIIFHLIHKEKDLEPWRPWFPDWDSTEPIHGGETTQMVLKKTVRALFRNSL